MFFFFLLSWFFPAGSSLRYFAFFFVKVLRIGVTRANIAIPFFCRVFSCSCALIFDAIGFLVPKRTNGTHSKENVRVGLLLIKSVISAAFPWPKATN